MLASCFFLILVYQHLSIGHIKSGAGLFAIMLYFIVAGSQSATLGKKYSNSAALFPARATDRESRYATS
jgi:hypothetical protein